MSEVHQIGPFRFDVATNALLRGGAEIKLEHRAARTLALLCRRRGEVVAQDQIVQEVWSGRTVSANSVAVVIGDLRRALGESAREPAFIVTVAKRGYRLNAAAEVPAPVETARPTSPRRPTSAALVVSAVVVAGLCVVGAAFGLASRHPPRITIDLVGNETGSPAYDSLAHALGELVVDRTSRLPGVQVERSASTGDPLRLHGELILWNNEPTLSLTLTRGSRHTIVWTDMAEGPADQIAAHTITAIRDLGARLDLVGHGRQSLIGPE